MTFKNPNNLKLAENKEVTVQDTMNELADIQLAQKKIITEKRRNLDIVKGGDPTLIAEIQKEISDAEAILDDATNKLRTFLQKKEEQIKIGDEKYSVVKEATFDNALYNENDRATKRGF